MRLHVVANEALRLLRASLPATVEMNLAIGEDAPEVLADAGQVHQVLMNLATNAAHAMGGASGCMTVELRTRKVDEAYSRTHPPLLPGTYAQLTVADTGHGMDEATCARIFEPFFTTKAAGEGTGLGLAVVRGIMEEHDGAIFVRSRTGEGTIFELFFPECAGPQPGLEEPSSGIPMGHGESVLLVDDEPGLCRAVGAMLERMNYRVTSFTDPLKAIDQFSQSPRSFDVVLTDNTMPRMTGIDLIREVHGLRPDIPTLLVSGITSTLNPEKLPSFGIRELVPKPVDPACLAQAVRRALDGRPKPKN